MKTLFLLLGLILAWPSTAATTLPPGVGTVARRDASSTNIPTTYTTGAAIKTGLSGKKNMTCCSTINTDLNFAYSTVTNCVGATDNGFIPAAPASSTICRTVENRATNTNFCVRVYTGGSAATSGVLNCDWD